MATKPALGKGLASLFPPVAPAQEASASATPPPRPPEQRSIDSGNPSSSSGKVPGVTFVNPDELEVNSYQPRREFSEKALEELTQSIKANGIIQPIVVRKNDKGSFELIAGERRLRASKRAGLKQVPIVIRRSTDRESLELALVENIQRQDLNCVEEAMGYFQLLQDFSLTQEEVARRVGKDRASVANHLRLLRLPEKVQESLKREELSFGHGKALLGLEGNALRLKAREEILKKKLSVREAEELVKQLRAEAEKPESKRSPRDIAADVSAAQRRLKTLSRDLSRNWSTKVEIKGSDRKGKIVLHYSNREDLERLLSIMENVETPNTGA